MKIESLQNEKVKFWAKLKEKKYRDVSNLFLVEDEHIVNEAIKYGVLKELIVLDVKEDLSIPTYQVTKEIMKKITDQVTIPPVIGVCEKLTEKEVEGPVLFLDGIQDPGNLGTILRSAVAFSMPNILLSEKCVDLYNPKVIRSTEGMIFHLNIKREETSQALKSLKEKGYTIIGTDVFKGTSMKDAKFSSKTVFVIGSEGQGMSSLVRDFCDGFIHIPMNPKCESLNAGVSASIIMYEFQSSRGKYE